jgi:hypothetical protein
MFNISHISPVFPHPKGFRLMYYFFVRRLYPDGENATFAGSESWSGAHEQIIQCVRFFVGHSCHRFLLDKVDKAIPAIQEGLEGVPNIRLGASVLEGCWIELNVRFHARSIPHFARRDKPHRTSGC